MGRGADGNTSRYFSVAEVKKHASAGDGWVVIQGKVRFR
jgi:cytochrome b involved in lipid metabolism